MDKGNCATLVCATVYLRSLLVVRCCCFPPNSCHFLCFPWIVQTILTNPRDVTLTELMYFCRSGNLHKVKLSCYGNSETNKNNRIAGWLMKTMIPLLLRKTWNWLTSFFAPPYPWKKLQNHYFFFFPSLFIATYELIKEIISAFSSCSNFNVTLYCWAPLAISCHTKLLCQCTCCKLIPWWHNVTPWAYWDIWTHGLFRCHYWVSFLSSPHFQLLIQLHLCAGGLFLNSIFMLKMG